MNALSLHIKAFDFDLEPIFKAYSDVNTYWRLPMQEHIIAQYDTDVNSRLRDLQFELGDVNGPVWKTENLDEETRKRVERAIGIKVVLETRELIEVFHTFHMMYVDNYNNIYNMPIKGVW